MKLRDYQQALLEQLQASPHNDLVQLDTGAGKTPIEAALAATAPLCLLVAHRNILITQISEKLAAFGLLHDTISTEHTRRRCIAAQRKHGRSFIQRGHATRLVCSIQSLLAQLERGAAQLDFAAPWLIVIDEAHHVIPDNMWGRLRTLFPAARIVGFTATPARMDGESLHISNGGLFDSLLQAPALGSNSVRTLIERGYLSDYVVYAGRPPKQPPLTQAQEEAIYERMMLETLQDAQRTAPPHANPTRRSAPTGLDWDGHTLTLDAHPVAAYQRIASGTQAIVMCPAISNAEEFADSFKAAGVPAACIHSGMTSAGIARVLDAFASGRVRVLTNVDMVGEGFDLPAVQTLIIATRTASFPRYRQWVGRVLRPAAGKKQATIIDLTSQVPAHGMPCDPVVWDLLHPPCGLSSLRCAPCIECGAYYPSKLPQCPHCGAANALHDRAQLGGYHFDIRLLDWSVVQTARAQIDAEKAQERRRTTVIRPDWTFGSGLINSTVTALRDWFIESLQSAGIAPAKINDFIESDAAKNRDFWMQHFTAADIKRGSKNKAKEVYQQWLKQP